MGAVLEVTELRKEYRTSAHPVAALQGVSLEVEAGEFVALMGASGSGKSTFLHLVGGLDLPSGGSIRVEGQDLGRLGDRGRTLFRRRRLGFVFQSYNLLATLTAMENVSLPALIGGVNGRGAEVRARSLLEEVHLGHRLDHRPQAMSGGEQQRVAIARALMNDPALILADEPTGNLDTKQGEHIWRLLAGLCHEAGRTVIAATHEPAGATFTDRIIFLKDGRVVGSMKPDGEGHAGAIAARCAELAG
jgi:putative ABC transport system ATP-binding protein